VQVRVLTTSTPAFDALQIDASTVRLGPADAQDTNGAYSVVDDETDGDNDAEFRFHMSEVGLDPLCTDTEITLVGETMAGDPFVGTKAISTACHVRCHGSDF
jgi:hypothetical protein